MNNQEAIEILGQYDVSDIHFYTTDGEEVPFQEWSDALELAISALEKQIPKKPEQSKTPRYGMGYEYYDWYCPTCGRFLAFESSNGDHHCTCGQKICWEKE